MPASVLVIIFVHFYGFVDFSQREMDNYFSFFDKIAHKIGQLLKEIAGYCFNYTMGSSFINKRFLTGLSGIYLFSCFPDRMPDIFYKKLFKRKV